jgi:hypothetical protein
MKPIKGWVPVDRDGQIDWEHFEKTRKECWESLDRGGYNDVIRDLKDSGWRLIKATKTLTEGWPEEGKG